MEDNLNKESESIFCNEFTIIFEELFNYENIDLKTAYLFGVLYKLSRKTGYANPVNKMLLL